MNMVLRAEHYDYTIDLTLSLLPEPLKRKSKRIGRSLDFSLFAGAAIAFDRDDKVLVTKGRRIKLCAG